MAIHFYKEDKLDPAKDVVSGAPLFTARAACGPRIWESPLYSPYFLNGTFDKKQVTCKKCKKRLTK